MTRYVGITLGEPLGIGPELVARVLSAGIPANTHISIYGSPNLMTKTLKRNSITNFWKSESISMIPVGPDPESGFTREDKELRAHATLAAIDQASTDVLQGKLDALITAPIDKSVVRSVLPTFTGHTRYLAEKAAVPMTYMLLDNTELRVLLVTEHVALRDVSCVFTQELLTSAIETASHAFREWFKKKKLRFAVVGLNPHAGEVVEMAEEQTVIEPIVKKLRTNDFVIEGPFSADSFFALARNADWDLILSPYHDQGLIAAKYPGLDKVVNITLGLPYLRVSPGHGVAYDLAGMGVADTRSFERALRIASSGRLES